MKKMLLLLILCTNSTYAAPSDATAITEPDCKTNEVTINEQALITRVCIRRPFLKPIEYAVTINGQSVFSQASDESRLRMSKRINEGIVQGVCLPTLQLYEGMSTKKAAKFSTLPADLASACSIKGNAADEAMPFIESDQCGNVLGTILEERPTSLLPVEVARMCKFWLEKKRIFSAEFSG